MKAVDWKRVADQMYAQIRAFCPCGICLVDGKVVARGHIESAHNIYEHARNTALHRSRQARERGEK